MPSLTLEKRDVPGILKHVYLCLGKEKIAYQDLVFFMAYDLLAFPPTTCEKILSAGKSEGLLAISTDKIVEFKLHSSTREGGYIDIIKAFSDASTIDKGVVVKDGHFIQVDINAKTANAKIRGDANQVLSIKVDLPGKMIHQDHDEPVGAFNENKTFLKYFIKLVIKNKDNNDLLTMLHDMHEHKKEWTFTFRHVGGK